MTIADISIVCNLWLCTVDEYDFSEFKNFTRYIARVKDGAAIPIYTDSYLEQSKKRICLAKVSLLSISLISKFIGNSEVF